MVRFRCRLRTILLMALIMGSPFQVALADLNEGLVAYYPFNGNANDESGNGNHGTVNGATLTEDRLGNVDSAYSFDGQNDYIEVEDNALLRVDGDLSMSVWIHIEKKQDSNILRKGHWDTYALANCNDGENFCYFHYYAEGSGKALGITHNESLAVKQWYHLIVIRNSNSIMLYMDGIKVAEQPYTEHPLVNSSQCSSLSIGAFCGGIQFFFSGIIDDIRIYNRTLSECEIQSLYTAEDECNPPPVACSDDPATYSNETRQAILPCVEIPLYTDINGSPLEFIGLHSAVLEIPFGFSDFEAKDLTFLEIIEESNPSHAHFNPDSGILDIPRIDIPTIVPLLGGETVPGPTLQCHAKLQQSAVRLEVLMLQDFDCNLP